MHSIAARIIFRYLTVPVFALLVLQSPAANYSRPGGHPAENPRSLTVRSDLTSIYGKLPLAFEPNVGQTDARVRFLARGCGMTAFFTDTETAMVLTRTGRTGDTEQTSVRMKLEQASQPRRIAGSQKLPGVSNYFIGNDPTKWRTDVPHYARIQSDDVYPGIDLVWYGNQQRLEYDFVVRPGANPNQIQVAYEGVESVRVDASGQLVLRTALGDLRQQQPLVYQEIGGKRVEVAAAYNIVARNRVTFALASYDRTRDLRIDPVVLSYSTFLGGSNDGDWGFGIAVDGAGSAYVTGSTAATNFPTQSPYQATLGGGFGDAYVTKLSPAGNALVYSTYLGGSSQEFAEAIAVDADGSAYVAGYTSSSDFPTYSPFQALKPGGWDAFVTKLSPLGNALGYSTYLGGSGTDWANGIAVDADKSAYVTGYTQSTDFPTRSPYQATLLGGQDAFVTKLSPSGNALAYSTYLGGNNYDVGQGIAVDGLGSAYVTGYTFSTNFPTQGPYQATAQGGEDVFVTKLSPSGNALAYSTYLGGSGGDSGRAIVVDGMGSAYVAGSTTSTNFPILSAFQATYGGNSAKNSGDAFVTKLAPDGDALVYSTFLGGSDSEGANGIAVDGTGAAYVTGSTHSTNFPLHSEFPTTFYQSGNDTANIAFVAKLAPAGNALAYSTYLGGTGGGNAAMAVAVDGDGAAYVTGATSAYDFPTKSPYQGTIQYPYQAAFVTKLTYTTPVWTIHKSHVGDFTQGQNGAAYTVTLSNTGSAATSGTVTVTETAPTGLALMSMAGNGWICPGTAANNCTRENALSAGETYPTITATVNVADAESQVTNQASVSGGGAVDASASDPTSILPFTCDINGSQATDIVDVQAMINEALGSTLALHDMNHDGVFSGADVRKVVGAVLGLGCVY